MGTSDLSQRRYRSPFRRGPRFLPTLLGGLVLTAGALSACTNTPPETKVTTAPAVTIDSEGPAAPARGAVMGAWVQPQTYTETGRIMAVTQFEQNLGRPLGVIQNYHPWADDFPSEFDTHIVKSGSTLLLSWSGTDTRSINSGRYDQLIRSRALAIKDLGTPILLRWRWEMDRPNLTTQVHSPADYIQAWRHIRSIFAAESVTNVGWVWCPLASGFDTGRAQKYYPGDAEVDWLCADAYAPDPQVSFQSVSSAFLTWAAAHQKPVIFAEVGAQGAGQQSRSAWLYAMAKTIMATTQIKAVVYFDSKVTEKGRVRDWSLRAVPKDFDSFKAIAGTSYFEAKIAAPN